MKKVTAIVTVVALWLACATPQTVRDSEKILKGEWTLSSITYDQAGQYNISLLNDASKDCFEGSWWRFIPNNNTGRYNISNAGCATGERYFSFHIQEIDRETGYYDFMLKPTDQRGRSETNVGYRMRLVHLDEQSMTWQQTVNVDGSPFSINMNFSKFE